MAIVLKYWNGRGLMEVPRMILAVSGRFPPVDYTDGRFDKPPTEGLDANMGRMPVAMVGDQAIGQSSAINHYLATECGLMGKCNVEAAQITSVSEHVKEMTASFKSVVPWGKQPSPESLDKWFNGGSNDLSGVAVRTGQSSRYLNWWMGRMELSLGTKGFAVGAQMSLADILLFNAFMDTLSPEKTASGVPRYRCEPFGDKARTDAALAKHPKILASCNVVAAHPNIQKWIKNRDVQMF